MKRLDTYTKDPPAIIVSPDLSSVANCPKGETRTDISSRIDCVTAYPSLDIVKRGNDKFNVKSTKGRQLTFDIPIATTTKPRTIAPSPAPGGALF